MIKEAVIFRVALILSTTIHISGFGLMWRNNHFPLLNGIGKTEGNIIVFEIGQVEIKKVDEKDENGMGTKLGTGSYFRRKYEPVPNFVPNSSDVGSSGYAEEDVGGVSNEYLLEVRKCIERVKFYPRVARRRLITGGVTVSFYIDCNGNPSDICIIKSSGSSILDNTASEMVLRASPFPKPTKSQYIRTTIVFML